VSVAFVICCSLAVCGRKRAPAERAGAVGQKAVIRVRGSDSMIHIAARWAEEYRRVAPGVQVEVSGGGSAPGFTALIEGAVDIADASRPPLERETAVAARRYPGRALQGTIVGYDAVAVFVHPQNPLDEIQLSQLRQIYVEGGTVARWSQLGVASPQGDEPIVLVGRQSSSGTYAFFREHVLENGDFRRTSHELNGTREVVALVAVTPPAIGFGGMGYATSEVKALRVSADGAAQTYAPTSANALARKYPLARPLALYTLGEPQGPVKDYVDWVRSDVGQAIVEACGYVSLPPDRRLEI
jgi:phosphate transport system substrate-binding protein